MRILIANLENFVHVLSVSLGPLVPRKNNKSFCNKVLHFLQSTKKVMSVPPIVDENQLTLPW